MMQNERVETFAPKVVSTDPVALTYGEEAIWLYERLRFQSTARSIMLRFDIQGPLDIARLSRSLTHVVNKHPNLRGNYVAHRSKPSRVIRSEEQTELASLDWSEHEATEATRLAAEAIEQLATTPFLLSKGPLLRAQLHRLSERSHILVLAFHQILIDDESVALLADQLLEAYGNDATGTPHAQLQAATYPVHAQRVRDEYEDSAEIRAYWENALDAIGHLQLPYIRARTSSSITTKLTITNTLAPEVLEKVGSVASECGTEPSEVFIGVLATLIHRYTGQHRFHIGVLSSTRTGEGLRDVIGFFGALLPLCIDMKGAPSFYDVAGHVADSWTDARHHAHVAPRLFDELLRRGAEPPHPPPFQVIFEHRKNRLHPRQVAGVDFTPSQAADNQLAAFDVALSVLEEDGGVKLVWEYNADLLSPETIVAMGRHYQTLLAGVLSQPYEVASELPLRSLEEQATWNARKNAAVPRQPARYSPLQPSADDSLLSLFLAQVAARPDAPAVSHGGTTLSYAQLNARANGLANVLIDRGCIGERCGLLLPQNELPIIAALAAMMAGNSYVPLDADMPAARLRDIANSAELAVVLTDEAREPAAREILSERPNAAAIDILPIAAAQHGPNRELDSEEVAYVLYTSGSTGQPKGVTQSHRNAVYHIATWANRLFLNPDDHVSQIPNFAWDSGFQDIFSALLVGACLHPFDVRTSGVKTLTDWIKRDRISVVHMTVPLFRELARAAPDSSVFESVRLVALGGDLIFAEDVANFGKKFPSHTWLANAYGATESSSGLMAFANAETSLDTSSLPLGYPAPNSEVTLLNEAGEQCAPYGIGEIVLRSPHLAINYWGDQSLSVLKFESVPNNPRFRQYRTGDLGRLLPDGSIEYAGRKDFQVKIRGYRVEIGDVEAALSKHPDVSEVVVQAFEDSTRSKSLAAYVRVATQDEKKEAELLTYLRKLLPEYMVPSRIVLVDQLPRTTTGKVDRRALKVPSAARRPHLEHEAPRTDLEKQLSELWHETLGIEPSSISREDSFFDIGGHSIVALALLARLYEVGLLPDNLQEDRARLLFENPTIAGMASWIEESRNLKDDSTQSSEERP